METILQLYKKHGDSEYFGEVVSKTTHMIQTAIAAQNNNEPDYDNIGKNIDTKIPLIE